MYSKKKIVLPFLFSIILLFSLNAAGNVYGYAIEEVPCFYEKGECIKWDSTKLTYHIRNEMDDIYPKYTRYVKEAISEWTNKTNGLFEFVELKHRAYVADIAIKILYDVSGQCRTDSAIGCTEINATDNSITSVIIKLANKECDKGKFTICLGVSDEKFNIAIRHEIGHALGLDHVKDNGIDPVDIMYYKAEYKTMQISKADVHKLGQMYGKSDNHLVTISTEGLLEQKAIFKPSEIHAKAGEKVIFYNDDFGGKDEGMHTITSGTVDCEGECWGLDFDSGILRPGNTFNLTLNEVGEYPYLCSLHPWMIGKVVIE